MARWLAVLAFLMLAGEAHASGFWNSGVELDLQCRSADEARRAACRGYIVAVADVFLGDDARVAGVRPCFRGGTSVPRLVETVAGYIERHPELRHFAAVIVVTMALEEAFPCR
jgi:hypothetical protein